MPRRARLAFAAFLVQLPLVLAAEAQSGPPKPPDLALEAYSLPNGLKVALHRDRGVPRVTVAVAYHVGSKNEKAGRTGFAHFFEHMMFRGTKNVPNYDTPLQDAGAQSNAFTSEDMTVYFETVPSNFLERALYLESERLAFLPSALDQAKFDTEREVVKNERRQSFENQPYGIDGETILSKVFPQGHPYSWSVIGSMDDLSRATLDDLKNFFAEFYHPSNATLCLAGDFDPDAAKALISKYFSPLAAGPKPKPVVVGLAPAVQTEVTQADRVKLPRVYWSWPTVADDHPDSPALDLLASVLAGGETSRLHRTLVLESRISKDVAGESDAKESAGLFTLQSTAAVGDDPATTLPKIEAAFASALKDIQATLPSADEVARALALFEKTSYSSLTSPLGRAVTLSIGFSQKSDARYYQKDFARYFAVTPADISRVAKAYLVDKKVVLKTLPVKPGEDPSKAAKAGPNPSAADDAKFVTRTPAAGPDWSKMPGPSAAQPFETPKFVRKSLANGLDVWFAPWKTLPLVSVSLTIPRERPTTPKASRAWRP